MGQAPEAQQDDGSRAKSRLSLGTLIRLAIFFGLAAGLLELVGLGITRFLLGKAVAHSSHVIWMAPVANTLLYLVIGLGVWAASRLMTESLGFRFSVFCFVLMAIVGLRFVSPGIHTAAWLVLSLGIAVVTTSQICARRAQFTSLAQHAFRLFVVVLLGLVPLAFWLEFRRAQANVQQAPPTDVPNVLLIVLDTLPAKNMGYHGYERPVTPNIDAFAKQGVIFEHGIATAPWTLTSHATMFTGKFPMEMTANWDTPLDTSSATLAEIFRDRGYFTVGVVANMLYCYREWGLDRGFETYDDYDVSLNRLVRSSYLLDKLTATMGELTNVRLPLERKSAAEINRRFLAALDDQPDRPFFAFLNYFDTHAPYQAPDNRHQFFSDQAITVPREVHTEAEDAEVKNAFDGCLHYLDEQIGSLLEELEKRGRLNNTLVIITSDHGEQFGEHDLFLHGNSLYRPLIHVPLLIVFPGEVAAEQRLAEIVTLRDLGSTILDLTQIDVEFPGNSWTRLWCEADDNTRELSSPFASVRHHIRMQNPGPTAKGDMRSVFAEGHQYIVQGDQTEFLFDFINDPLEESNLAEQEEYAPLMKRCRDLLKAQPSLEP